MVLWLTGGDGREEEFKVPDHTQPVSVLRKDDDDIKLNKYKASGVTQWLLHVNNVLGNFCFFR